MKFSEVEVGMLVSVTGKYASEFPNGAEVIETDSMDDSIKIRNRETGRTMFFFFDNERSAPSIFCDRYPMKDIHPLVDDTPTKPYFRKLPPLNTQGGYIFRA